MIGEFVENFFFIKYLKNSIEPLINDCVLSWGFATLILRYWLGSFRFEKVNINRIQIYWFGLTYILYVNLYVI